VSEAGTPGATSRDNSDGASRTSRSCPDSRGIAPGKGANTNADPQPVGGTADVVQGIAMIKVSLQMGKVKIALSIPAAVVLAVLAYLR